MPRKKTLRVTAYPDIRADYAYPVSIVNVEVLRDTLNITVRHLSAEQEGRPQVVTIGLPIRPDGLGASLFRGCGFPTEIDSELDPKAIVGAVVNVRLAARPGTTEFQPIAFEQPVAKEAHQ